MPDVSLPFVHRVQEVKWSSSEGVLQALAEVLAPGATSSSRETVRPYFLKHFWYIVAYYIMVVLSIYSFSLQLYRMNPKP